MSSLGFALLAKLGLRSEEANLLKKKSDPNEAIYVRDERGIGYTEIPSNFLEASENAFAKLQRARIIRVIDSDEEEEKPIKLERKPAQQRRYIPERLRKKDVGSMSNEDLAHIFASDRPISNTMETVKAVEESVETAEEIAQNTEEEKPRRRRRRHRHHHQDGEEQQAPAEPVV